jgi:hypothetical protein
MSEAIAAEIQRLLTEPLYPYFCGEPECRYLDILSMPEITKHWQSHRSN